ncbi:hypothetical protein ACQ4LE_003422 [Meloidogyne hapla]
MEGTSPSASEAENKIVLRIRMGQELPSEVLTIKNFMNTARLFKIKISHGINDFVEVEPNMGIVGKQSERQVTFKLKTVESLQKNLKPNVYLHMKDTTDMEKTAKEQWEVLKASKDPADTIAAKIFTLIFVFDEEGTGSTN